MLFCCHTAALYMNATGARQPQKLFRLCWCEIGMPFVGSLRLTFLSTGRSWCAVTHTDGLHAPGITGEKVVKRRCGIRTSISAYVKHEWWYVGSLKYVKCWSEIRLKTGSNFSYSIPRAVKSIVSDSGYNSQTERTLGKGGGYLERLGSNIDFIVINPPFSNSNP